MAVGSWPMLGTSLYDLWIDKALYDDMSRVAVHSVSDEFNTVGKPLSCFYLASRLSKGGDLAPNGRLINDMRNTLDSHINRRRTSCL